MEVFPELRNGLTGVVFPTEALKFGVRSSRIVRQALHKMNGLNELERLCEMFRLLPVIFTASDYSFAGKPVRMERDVRRMQQIHAYVMAHYIHPISLDDMAAETGMNRSAFCSYFKRCKGMTFSQFVTQYRLNTACELLKHSQKSVSEVCYLAGFYSGLSEKYRNDPVAISEAIAADLTLPVSVLSFLTVALRRYFENLTVL